MTSTGSKKAFDTRNPRGIMLTRRPFIYVLLGSSLLLNGWTWFSKPSAPQLDKVFLKYPFGDQGFVYGVSTNGGGATVGFDFRFYLSEGKSGDDEILASLIDASPFLITKDPEVKIETRGGELDVRVRGRVDQFHSQALIRRSSHDYSVININLMAPAVKPDRCSSTI